MHWSTRLAVAGAIILAVGVTSPAAGAVVGACHVSPIVRDLDRSVRFYRDLLGLEVSSVPPGRPIPWDTRLELLELHGLPAARLRSVVARVPGSPCGVELIEFDRVERTPVRRRMPDPGAVTLILLVRDIDAAFARLKAAGVTIATTGGAPVRPSPTSNSRAVIVEDPDGHFVELAQLDPLPASAGTVASNVFDVRFRVTVNDLDQIAQYYRDHLGIDGKPGAFARSVGVMAMMGLPDSVEYRMSVTQIPGSTLILEVLELKGIGRAVVRARVQDPGGYRLQLQVEDIDSTLSALRNAGSQVISTSGAPVRMMFERPWRLAVVGDPANVFMVLRQGPLAQ